MVKFKIKIQDPDGDFIGEFETFKRLKFGKRLSNYGQAEFSIPVNIAKTASLIALRRYSVWIYREDENGEVLLWSGEQALRKSTLDSGKNNWATIQSFDWLEQLAGREVDGEVSFTGQERAQIGWSLINTTQGQTNGNFGATEGEIETTPTLDIDYNDDNILDALRDLSSGVDGFDFELNNFKVYNAKPMFGIDRTNSVIFEYGHNVKSMTITEDFVNPVNRAKVKGEDIAGTTLRVIRNDTVLQGLYKIREKSYSELDRSEQSALESKGDAAIRKNGQALFKIDIDILPSVTPNITQFSLGDLITLKVKEGIYDIQEAYRLYEWQVEYTDNNTEKLSLVLGNFIV